MVAAVLLWCAAVLAAPAVDLSEVQQWRSRILSALKVPTPAPELAPVVWSTFQPEPGIVAERVTYGTQFGMRIPAIVYRPERPKGRVPGLIIVNGHGGDKYSWYAFYSGILYARAGAVVVTYDPLGEGERNPQRLSGTRAHDKLKPEAALAHAVAGQMISDVQQAVRYLSGRPDVDAGRIAAAGYSMGSFVLALSGAVEPKLKAVVLVGGGNLDGAGEYWDRSKPLCQGLPYQALSFLGDRAAALYAMHAVRGPLLIYNGLADSVVNIPKTGEPFFEELQRRTRALAPSGSSVFETGFEAGISHRPFFVTRPVALWLERQVDFPEWTEDQIREMPVTLISDWSKSNNVEMDPLYAVPDREGGALGLGRGVPGLRREQLHVIPAGEWEKERRRMTIDQWEGATNPH
ncbi:MAG: alpha/beta fold hydrolase [Bryobacteraceae bacterium]